MTAPGPLDDVLKEVVLTDAERRLIAAAPKMLEALKAALMCMEAAAKLRDPNWDGFAHPDSPITLARSAIAKATMTSAYRATEQS